MKITSTNRDGNRFIIEIEEEYPQFLKAVDKALIEAGKEVRIPGFRAGKAPKEMVEKFINHDVMSAHAAQNLIADLYPKIIDEVKIDPVGFPKVDIIQQKEKKPFIFKISVDVYPEIKLGKYKGLKVDKKDVKISEADVIKVLGNFQQRLVKPGPDEKKELQPLDYEFAKKISQHWTLAEL